MGRLPVVVSLETLDETSLVRILMEPKNALTKQYAKLFELEDVRLTFDKEALQAVAQKTLKRGTGARGLRAVLEEVMTEIMYDLPGPRRRLRGGDHAGVHPGGPPAADGHGATAREERGVR